MANFLVECTRPNNELKKAPTKHLNEQPDPTTTWILDVDGALNSLDSKVGLILENIVGVVAEYVLQFAFKVTNNQAKYEALLAGLKLAKQLEVNHSKVFTNS